MTDIFPGVSYPLGATIYDGGVNFCVFSHNCTAIELLLFDHHEDTSPARVIPLNPDTHRTFYYWHVFIKGLDAGQLYSYRVWGPYDPSLGLRYDGEKVLIDPYAYAVAYGDNYSRQAAQQPGDNCAQAMKSVVVDPRVYDWEGDAPLRRPFSNAVIYEMHVAGFTRHPSSGVDPDLRGTYAGLIQKIPYLQDLGITAVELLPVQQFDEQDVIPPLKNYWGYNPIVFFAPHRGYSSDQTATGPVREFKDMVKAFHRAGIEVILDVVFNHTAEGDHTGPTLSFRGFENRAYYILSYPDQSYYADYSGTGNSIYGNHSITRRMILDCLRYWVQVMHVDGFRFDLASVLARDKFGNTLTDPPILWEIESDPILAGTKIIAEAWDAAGLYQVGSFIGHRWAEWNGQYRDDVRRFFKGDPETVIKLAERIAGSRDLYPQPDRQPNRSVNFITAHDGFTLNDLVSYTYKHNFANGEYNRDGHDANFSWNGGLEGPTDNPEIEALRIRQIKNFTTILMLSQGTPMHLMGDEVRRTQLGNNNAYCQDNEISWFNWDAVQEQKDILRFVKKMIQFYHCHTLFHTKTFWTLAGGPDIIWHGVRIGEPDWGRDSHSLAFELVHPERKEHLYVMLNAYWKPLDFELPAGAEGVRWFRVIDTNRESPDDFPDSPVPLPDGQASYRLQPRSVVLLTETPCSRDPGFQG
ncbi:MAG: glycogen debranching protein GlgX [Anaerolineales bacterium]|nr:glycogen debranching protein GlgX [Anaerolineales bacterium]